MSATYTPDLEGELFGGPVGDDNNSDFNDAFQGGDVFDYDTASATPPALAAEVVDNLPAQDLEPVSSEMQAQDAFQHLDFDAVAAYQPGDDLQDVAGDNRSAIAHDLEPSKEDLLNENAHLKAMLMASMGITPLQATQYGPAKTPPRQTPPKRPQTTPRKRKTATVTDIDISPSKKVNPGPIEAMWSPGVGSDNRRAIQETIASPQQTYSSSPAANNITAPTPVPKATPKKARTPAAKRTPATKKTAQQPQRPQRAGKYQRAKFDPAVPGVTTASVLALSTSQTPGNQQRSMTELYDARWGAMDQYEKARILLPMLQGLDPLTGKKVAKPGRMAQDIQEPIAEAPAQVDLLSEIANHMLKEQSNSELAHGHDNPQTSITQQDSTAITGHEESTGWPSPTPKPAVGWASPTQEQAAGWQSPAQNCDYTYDIDQDFDQFAQEEAAASNPATESSDAALQQVEPSHEVAAAPQTTETQALSLFDGFDSDAIPANQTSPFSNDTAASTPDDATPNFDDFFKNAGDVDSSNAGNGDSCNGIGGLDFSNKGGNVDLFNNVSDFGLFDFTNAFKFDGAFHTGLTPIEASFGAYVHTGLTPTDTSFNSSVHTGLPPTTMSFNDSVHTGLTPTNNTFAQTKSTGCNPAPSTFDNGVNFPDFGFGLDVYQNVGATRQREALINHQRRVSEGRRR
ncbi:hypothetical protein EK21DRAFT_92732 [Setomelanomma holmii]|uniref:Uncharacterized protein n=1 Tax=Setomelanomma holmii TaxID=210430 RepID=A0A9P4H315_9PLEO|nr:hypothetical protein EK21DRAFT_92732 [Setomelanomma holmii]